MDQLDEESKRALTEFEERVQDCACKLLDTRDEFYLKWLVARSYNVAEAEKMLRAVIYISAQGNMDLRGIFQSITKKDFMRFQAYTTERINKEMREESLRTGTNKNCQVVFIGDMTGLSMRQMTYKPVMDAGSEQTKVYESNYPENIRRMFIINGNVVTGMKLRSQTTLDKIRIFGYDKEEWTAALLEEIEADNLPLHYGGTMVDPDGDPKCPSKFNMGGEVPYSYYLSNSAPVPKDYMETINIIAGAGGFKKLKYKIDVANSILRWEFMTEGGDIGFKVYYKSAEEGIVDLVPLSRIESHLITEEGQYICEDPGKYVVVFDNTFSILRPKKVRYYVAVDPPVPGS
ncbi:hypothetical protein DAPPUDRAFT_238038 [Daphnia pulex]|uniref:CRAL-TRIO domain-containing protein n=1 Tax=Daphnia pulex TaxID=6669 RepID=E9G524_DAPPU|nr:hypothetical protein DAPPUDRAFT_238038 [Daphnia pulex]|eukprot:EFX85396.1 hypothetical protein DAPPUDRAFT_238038 [Daphnia pulex]